MVLFYFLSKVNAIGLLTHSYQKSCALRGSSVHKTRIYNLEKKFGVWALPNEKRCTYIHHACENSNRAKHSLNFRRNVTVSQDKYNNQVLCWWLCFYLIFRSTAIHKVQYSRFLTRLRERFIQFKKIVLHLSLEQLSNAQFFCIKMYCIFVIRMKYKKSLQCNTGKLACVHAKNLSQKRRSLACTHIGVYTRTAFTEMVRF